MQMIYDEGVNAVNQTSSGFCSSSHSAPPSSFHISPYLRAESRNTSNGYLVSWGLIPPPGENLWQRLQSNVKYFQTLTILQLEQKIFALVAVQPQVQMTFESRLVPSAPRTCEPIWSVPESCVQSKIKWTVKSPLKVLLKEVKCITCNVLCVCVCVCILTSLAVSGASALIPLPTPPPSREQGKDHSFFKVSLSSPPHHPIVWGRGREGAAPADRTTLLPRSSPPSHSPHPPTCFRGAVKPFLTLKNVFLLFCSSVLWFPSDHLHRLGSPSPPTPPSGLFFSNFTFIPSSWFLECKSSSWTSGKTKKN